MEAERSQRIAGLDSVWRRGGLGLGPLSGPCHPFA